MTMIEPLGYDVVFVNIFFGAKIYIFCTSCYYVLGVLSRLFWLLGLM